MPITLGSAKRRWVRVGDRNHVLYERDGSAGFTLCGQLIRVRCVSAATPSEVRQKCNRCMSLVKKSERER